MRTQLQYLLRRLLRLLARAVVKKYAPFVVGVTGSVGKSSTKEAIAAVLRADRPVRASGGNLNNEFGLPLAVIGDYDRIEGGAVYLRAILRAASLLLVPREYAKTLVLEYGADRPGDLRELVSIVRPNLAVVTAVGETPVHLEFYDSPAAVAREKQRLVEAVPRDGFVVLNADDPAVAAMRERTRAFVTTFGFGEDADLRVVGFEHLVTPPDRGVAFKLIYKGSMVPVVLRGIFGRGQVFAAAAAAAVGLRFGMNLVTISEALGRYRSLPGRTRLLSGVKNTEIIDDSYNAAPASVREALALLTILPAPRKIAVLGSMAELGAQTIPAHEALGGEVARVADLLVAVGNKARFFAEGARKAGYPKEKIIFFESADAAALPVQELLREGDLVLVKGSQSARMERIVLECMAEPEKAEELLVRQYGKWLKE